MDHTDIYIYLGLNPVTLFKNNQKEKQYNTKDYQNAHMQIHRLFR